MLGLNLDNIPSFPLARLCLSCLVPSEVCTDILIGFVHFIAQNKGNATNNSTWNSYFISGCQHILNRYRKMAELISKQHILDL